MPTEVTDPAILEQLNADTSPDDAPAPAAGQPVTDPAILRMLNADKPQDDDTPLGQRVPTSFPTAADLNKKPQDELPFWDRVHLAQADNWGEKKLYLEKAYGKGSVKEEWGDDGRPAAVVHAPDGHVFRIGDDGFVATLVGHGAEGVGMAGGAAYGAMLGAPAGPVGIVVGGALGGAVGALIGKGGEEVVKHVEGLNNKSADEEGYALRDAEIEGMSAEAVGGITGKVVSKALTASLPGVVTGTTDVARDMTRRIWEGGGRVSYKAMAPALKKIQLVEKLDERLNGEAVKMQERNQGFILNHVEKTLSDSGVPKPYVDKIVEDMRDPQGALSHENVGQDIKQAVQTHVDTLQAALDQTTQMADAQIDAQLAGVNKIIDKTTHNGLDETVGGAIQAAKQTFQKTARAVYGRIDTALGGKKVVDTRGIYDVAREIVKKMPPSAVSKMIRDAAQNFQKEMSPEDALLMTEFGIEMDKDAGRITFGEAQNARSLLRERGKAGELNRSISQGANLRLAGAYDEAIQNSARDPQVLPYINLLNKTDAWYKETNAKFKDATIKGFIKRLQTGMPRDPESIVDTIAEVGQSSRTGQIRKIVGEDTWKRVQSVHMNKFLGQYAERGPDGKPIFDGLAMLKDLDKGDTALSFEQIHGKGSLKDMRDIATMIAARRGQMTLPPDWLSVGGAAGPRASVLGRQDAAAGNELANVDTAKADRAWASDSGYVSPGGAGGIGDRYQQAKAGLGDTSKMEAPSAAMVPGPGGAPQMRFNDGRSRFAAMRDAGDKSINVAMDAESRAFAAQHGMLIDQANNALAKGNFHLALESMKTAQARLDDFMNNNALKILMDPKRSGEEAYQWVAGPGAEQERNLTAAVKLFGIASPQIANLRQAALEDVMRQASIKSIGANGNSAIKRAIDSYTDRQAQILFPDGLKGDLKAISDVIGHMLPEESGLVKKSNSGSLIAGGILMMPIVTRIPIQVTIGVMRSIVQNPRLARWICIGRKENEFAWMNRTAMLLDKMAAQVTMDAEQKKVEQPAPTMPGPATLQ